MDAHFSRNAHGGPDRSWKVMDAHGSSWTLMDAFRRSWTIILVGTVMDGHFSKEAH